MLNNVLIESLGKNHVSNKSNYIDTYGPHVYELNMKRHTLTVQLASPLLSCELCKFHQISKKKAV
jgi:hypothetical protein